MFLLGQNAIQSLVSALTGISPDTNPINAYLATRRFNLYLTAGFGIAALILLLIGVLAHDYVIIGGGFFGFVTLTLYVFSRQISLELTEALVNCQKIDALLSRSVESASATPDVDSLLFVGVDTLERLTKIDPLTASGRCQFCGEIIGDRPDVHDPEYHAEDCAVVLLSQALANVDQAIARYTQVKGV